MNRVLFVHGFNGNPNGNTATAVRHYFETNGDKFVSALFDLTDYDRTIKEIKSLINDNRINIIVSHSMGAFYVMSLNDDECFKVVINPCMYPSIEIPLIDSDIANDKEWIEYFKSKEDVAYSKGGLIAQTTFGIFGTNDELVSYSDEFNAFFGCSIRNIKNNIMVSGGHQLSENSIETGLSRAMEYFDALSKTIRMEKITESVINEHYVNILTKDDKEKAEKLKQKLYDFIQKGYASVGGAAGLTSPDDLIDNSDFWKLDVTGDNINAAIIYTFKRGGRKIQFATSDGTKKGKSALSKITADDINLIDRNAWAECSEAPEHIRFKAGAVPIPVEIVKELLPDKEIREVTPEDVKNYKGKNKIDDGFHYVRNIGGKEYIKVALANKSGTVDKSNEFKKKDKKKK